MTIAPTTITLIHIIDNEDGTQSRIAIPCEATFLTEEMVEEADDIELID